MRTRFTWPAGLAVAAVLALVGAACSSNEGDVSATEKDFAITLDPSSAAAGKVTFSIQNDGPSAHEFVVVQSDEAPDALPVENNEVAEDQLTIAGEEEDIAPGTTVTLDLNLDPGNYVIICNVTGHYESGMHTGFTVT